MKKLKVIPFTLEPWNSKKLRCDCSPEGCAYHSARRCCLMCSKAGCEHRCMNVPQICQAAILVKERKDDKVSNSVIYSYHS